MSDIERTTVQATPPTTPLAAADGCVLPEPSAFGRYRVERVIGEGGFGKVYLAHDDQLRRAVAVKVPHARLVAHAADAEEYLNEARTVAGLDHPHIVPVYDVGSTADFPCFVVSKYIDGTDLAARMAARRAAPGEAAAWVATVAVALHHAHQKGLVHRDVKPGNILLDRAGRPFVGDFGLALREQDVGTGPRYAGTPSYMSPEQARGEGHRVDGRSDVFSLGVVLYELLTGRKPFKADTQADLFDQIARREPRPPRQYDDAVPKELERICLKALSKRAGDRYSTAKDMAADLHQLLADQPDLGGPDAEPRPHLPAAAAAPVAATPTTPATPTSDRRPVRLVPKGLRAFDAHDADFFLDLVPGPRDRDGVPDGIRFWKTRLDETDPDHTFAVGLIYGPSGCGKSSLVKAGLLPRLSEAVIPVYVEATADDTETRLLAGLRKRCPALPDGLSLPDTLAALRRGPGVPAGKKVVIVLDQFEQWLHAKTEERNTELVQALRQCDGGRVQAVVTVRDDFWLAVSRFLRDLEVRLVDGQNSALADLFDPDHARKVLTAFGRAFGKLPESGRQTTAEQAAFLDRAVAGLAEGGKVVSVRLALFAEMMKGKPWTPAALRAVGGPAGVGVTFLEETFAAATAPPERRYHQQAARRVLRSLLPAAGTDIRGHMRSRDELLAASGYARRPTDFDDLMRILDGEVRLITPTDPDGRPDDGPPAVAGGRYYQLTHDFLVPALRDWLTRKQKETRRGRAELLLADRAAVWAARPEARQLPSLAQWLSIRWRTAANTWTEPQRKMMGRAARYHQARGLALVVLIGLLAAATWVEVQRVGRAIRATEAAGMVQAVLTADTAKVPDIVAGMTPYRAVVDPLLCDEYANAAADSRRRLHASLALLPADPTQVEYLSGRLLDAAPPDVPVIRDALAPHAAGLVERLWAVAEHPPPGRAAQRLRAAAALARYDPDGGRWATAGPLVADALVRENPVFLGAWTDAFRGVKARLLPRFGDIFRDPSPDRAAERSVATNLLADYAADDAAALADLLMDADERQFAVLFPVFHARAEPGVPVLSAELAKTVPPDLPASDDRREALAKRQANAAVLLLRCGRPAGVWPLLKHSPDPRVRSYLVHKLGPLGADATAVIGQLEAEPDVTVRRGLLLSLGEFAELALPPAARGALLPKLQALYRTEPDAGLHAAAEWLLRQWGQDAWLAETAGGWAKDAGGRAQRLETIRQHVAGHSPAAAGRPPDPRWYVNTQGQTLVVVPGPVAFAIGSPVQEQDRTEGEAQHPRRIRRSFAIGQTAVTLAEYRTLTNDPHVMEEKYTHSPDLPVVDVSWYMAARYCNRLSRLEGLDECYEVTGPGPQDVRMKAGYLGRSGYRLPTEAEVEYATRAGATTSRYYGESAELLGRYAWYTKNTGDRLQRVGWKKPNDFGLFDAHGNSWTWCQDEYHPYPAGGRPHEDAEGALEISGTVPRVLRGGSCLHPASTARSAPRSANVPTLQLKELGFRVARTLPP